jgi:hypothetical protein
MGHLAPNVCHRSVGVCFAAAAAQAHRVTRKSSRPDFFHHRDGASAEPLAFIQLIHVTDRGFRRRSGSSSVARSKICPDGAG